MNNYSLAADSRRWWWLPATGGAIATAAVTAILAVPATSTGAHVEPPATDPALTDSVTVVPRPCYFARRGWNTPRGWEQPVCKTLLRRPAERPEPGRGRPAPDYLP
jgi:hypothetical protein